MSIEVLQLGHLDSIVKESSLVPFLSSPVVLAMSQDIQIYTVVKALDLIEALETIEKRDRRNNRWGCDGTGIGIASRDRY